MEQLKPYAKALFLLGLIVLAAVAQLAGVDLGLDIAHFVVLLLANLGVYAVPNNPPVE
jgi:Na+-translocating ferredoxin:NAD+ oxidoreductase RnfE subunit